MVILVIVPGAPSDANSEMSYNVTKYIERFEIFMKSMEIMRMANSEHTALNVAGVGSLRLCFGEFFGIAVRGGEAETYNTLEL